MLFDIAWEGNSAETRELLSQKAPSQMLQQFYIHFYISSPSGRTSLIL